MSIHIHPIRKFASTLTGLALLMGACATTETDDPGFAAEDELDTHAADLTAEAEDLGEEAQDDADASPTTDMTAEVNPAASSAMPQRIDRLRLRNGTGPCMYRTGNVVGTQNCSTSGSQLWDVYEQEPGKYHLCTTAAPVYGPYEECIGDLGPACFSGIAWTAMCVDQTSYNTSDVRIYRMALSAKWDGQASWVKVSGNLRYETGNFIGIVGTSRKLTRNSSGVVVAGSYSGHPNQVWNVY